MNDALFSVKIRLSDEVDREPFGSRGLITDLWVAKSMLQKAIRRGEAETATTAALTVLVASGSALWRRFMIIAAEDVGAASVDTFVMTVAACTDPAWRKWVGGDAAVAASLARLLAGSPKSRSTEHLITASHLHPSLEHDRQVI